MKNTMNNTMKSKTVLTLAGLSVLGSLLLTSALAAPPKTKKPPVKKDTPAMIAAGKKIYEEQGCGGCHAIGETGGKTGPELTKVGADPKHNAKWLTEAVVKPTAHNPSSTMPAYEDKIKGKDLTNIVAYLGSLKK